MPTRTCQTSNAQCSWCWNREEAASRPKDPDLHRCHRARTGGGRHRKETPCLSIGMLLTMRTACPSLDSIATGARAGVVKCLAPEHQHASGTALSHLARACLCRPIRVGNRRLFRLNVTCLDQVAVRYWPHATVPFALPGRIPVSRSWPKSYRPCRQTQVGNLVFFVRPRYPSSMPVTQTT